MPLPKSLCRVKHEARIAKSCPVLQPTGCTAQFCQSGRMNRPLEPMIGENRPINTIKLEAEAFLQEMYDEGFFENNDSFHSRLREVLDEIETKSISATVWIDQEIAVDEYVELQRVQVDGWSSSGWIQNKAELEWGIRVSWRNARKCIMRAHFQDLVLVDLRHVNTSRGMVDALIERLPEAYNGERIQPTVFIFPPRSVNEMGPMFWSPQLLTFAGVGFHPRHAQDGISFQSLPMAEGDEPVFAELPHEMTELVSIQHPGYTAFAKLDFNWCKFPALSKLGFDIGGVQYTASPFVGWFMDAEIAVRNLADSFRYNVLPDICKAIGWRKKDLDFEDLPEHEKLLWMSRAQAELNFAVHYSFMKAGVTLTSSLAASNSWTAFDDQHLQNKGYRLNADPYWIAPPQGSIIPLWHRGGAPNYQPKPLIAKHRYDPVKIWKARIEDTKSIDTALSETSETTVVDSLSEPLTRVHILWSGTGGTASKLAERLRKNLQCQSGQAIISHFGTLNSVPSSTFQFEDVVLLVISSTGKGQMPQNGQHFIEKMQRVDPKIVSSLHFAIFGIGDSGYRSTFNAAAKSAHQFFEDAGSSPLDTNGIFNSDVALENPPLASFQSWWKSVDSLLDGSVEVVEAVSDTEESFVQELAAIDSYEQGSVHIKGSSHTSGRIVKLLLEVSKPYQAMSHIRVLPQNSTAAVNKVLWLLGISDEDAQDSFLPIGKGARTTSVRSFLTEYVDLERPCRNLDWMTACPSLVIEKFENLPAISTLESLFNTPHPVNLSSNEIREILFSMTPFRPRYYSIASSPNYKSSPNSVKTTNTVELLVKILPDGRFSSHTLASLGPETQLRYKIIDHKVNEELVQTFAPIVAVACGTGFAPLRSLIQHRIARAQTASFSPLCRPNSSSSSEFGKLTLFVGFKQEDREIFTETLDDARKYGVLDAAHMVQSNAEKRRVQDLFADCREKLASLLQGEGQGNQEAGYLFICGNLNMASDVKEKMREVLGDGVWDEIVAQSRVIEEIF